MSQFIPLFALFLVLLVAGCQPKTPDSAHHEEPVSLGPQFSPRKGLLIPEDTRRSIDLKIVEVTEQKVPARIVIQMRVYRIGENAGHATGFITSEQAASLKVGQPVVIHTDAAGDMTAKVVGLDDGLQKAAGMTELLVAIPLTTFKPAVGAFLQASVTLASSESAVTIPQTALLQCSDGHSVYTVNGEHFVRTPVKVGAANGGLVEIKDGLYAGDQVVSQPVMSLWLTELAAVKGGQACCVMPAEGTRP